jgi:hypothetical protein
MIERIDPEHVMKKAMSIIQDAQRLIKATHLLSDTSQAFPKEYTTLLEKKLQEGVQVKRIACGTQEQFSHFNTDSSVKHLSFECIRADPSLYQRMLIIDKSTMLFAIENPHLKVFFYTDEQQILHDCTQYFDKIFSS